MSNASSSRALTAISLFASSGIGDLALRSAGGRLLVANEFMPDRAGLLRVNFPEAEVIAGDIRELWPAIVDLTRERLGEAELDVLFATPPCQGMSKNGRGKLLRGVRDGLRDALDPRNQLATFVPPIVSALKPRLVVFENVPEMDGTLILDEHGGLVELLDAVAGAMPDYVGCWKVVEFADYGVPQRRQRLITVFIRRDVAGDLSRLSRRDLTSRVFPPPTHSQAPTLLETPWITVSEVIGHLPPLDAKSAAEARHPELDFHYVPLLDEQKYWWVANTPPGFSAFDNQCANPECGFKSNPTHGTSREGGINRARVDTPIFCVACGSLLPRPIVHDEDGPRLMKGFTSAYKRMSGSLPASAMTRNLSYACSDQKLHPTQNRVLSLLEAMMLQTIADYEYKWILPNGKRASDKLIRDSIGESVPPRGLQMLFEHLFARVLDGRLEERRGAA